MFQIPFTLVFQFHETVLTFKVLTVLWVLMTPCYVTLFLLSITGLSSSVFLWRGKHRSHLLKILRGLFILRAKGSWVWGEGSPHPQPDRYLGSIISPHPPSSGIWSKLQLLIFLRKTEYIQGSSWLTEYWGGSRCLGPMKSWKSSINFEEGHVSINVITLLNTLVTTEISYVAFKTFFMKDVAGKLQTTAVSKTLYLLLPQSSEALSMWHCTFECCLKLALHAAHLLAILFVWHLLIGSMKCWVWLTVLWM